MIGLKRGTVKLFPYNPEWKDESKKEEGKLQRLLSDLAVDIQHIGSTSIPGMIAKPIIDIDVGIKSVRDFNRVILILTRQGYDFRENAHNINVHILFAKGPEKNRTYYIHVIKYNGNIWKKDLAFRDYLRTHKTEAKEYSNLKISLESKFLKDRERYTKNKRKFIRDIISSALMI